MGNEKKENGGTYKALKLLDKINRDKLMAMDKEDVVANYINQDKEFKVLHKLYNEALEKIERMENESRARENSLKPVFKYSGYDKGKTWIEKVRFILEKNARGMKSSEIKAELLTLEPEVKEGWADVDNYISQILFSACKSGVIVKTKANGNTGYFYVLPE